ncbi:MAG TPA: hypothetical protein VL243_17790, partial [Vicinamibacterales bacterium]|nr:hypothetical protein [Vicinamibacterales bacterium]
MAHIFPRVVVIVMDSVGIGELDDAGLYGDRGSNTLGNIARRVKLRVPTLRKLGLGKLVDLGPEKVPGTFFDDREETGRVPFSAESWEKGTR